MANKQQARGKPAPRITKDDILAELLDAFERDLVVHYRAELGLPDDTSDSVVLDVIAALGQRPGRVH